MAGALLDEVYPTTFPGVLAYIAYVRQQGREDIGGLPDDWPDRALDSIAAAIMDMAG